jgi:hypothetical protein
MKTNLFMNMQDQLWEFCREKKLFSTSDVYAWGVGRYTRACRTVREWAAEGRLRRLEAEEMVRKGLRQSGRAAVQYYEVV